MRTRNVKILHNRNEGTFLIDDILTINYAYKTVTYNITIFEANRLLNKANKNNSMIKLIVPDLFSTVNILLWKIGTYTIHINKFKLLKGWKKI